MQKEIPLPVGQAEAELKLREQLLTQLDQRLGVNPGSHVLQPVQGHKFVITNAKPHFLQHPHQIEIMVGERVAAVCLICQNKISSNEEPGVWRAIEQVLASTFSSSDLVAV